MIMACCRVGTITVPECIGTLTIPVGLSDGEYTVTITDRFNKKYTTIEEINENSELVLTISNYPLGLFTSYSGASMLEIFDGCERQTITMCNVEYGYITMTFYSENAGIENYTVCCN